MRWWSANSNCRPCGHMQIFVRRFYEKNCLPVPVQWKSFKPYVHMNGMLTSSNGNIFRSPMNSPHKGQWRWALKFSLICVWINGWVNNHEAGDLRRYRARYDVTDMNPRLTVNIAIVNESKNETNFIFRSCCIYNIIPYIWTGQGEFVSHWHSYVDGLMQERRNSSALAMELRLSCIDP